jgi:tetratricopeptide (TPR) repeat protein
LNAFVALVLELVQQYDGYFKDLDFGDKGPVIVCVFGAPLAHENDLERAADFLLALAQKGQDVSWRAGLAYGTVYAGLVGGEARGEYTALGDVVNLAARLMQQARWGQCWISEVAAERLQHGHRVESLGRFALKGKTGRIPAWRLAGRRTTAAPLAFDGTLVGRESELAALIDFLQPLRAGRFAGVAAILGEAGMGKSRLAYEVQQRLDTTPSPAGEKGEWVGWFLCPADDILRQSLNPFKHWLRHYFEQLPDRSGEANRDRFDRLLDGLIAELRAAGRPRERDRQRLAGELERTRSFLGALLDLHWAGSLYDQLEPRLRFENTLLALKALVLAETLRRPVVLQLEDVHCLDPASGELIRLLARNVADYPLALLCTSRYRDDGTPVQLALDEEVPQLVIELGTLTPAGARALAGQLLGGAIGEELAAFLVEKTQGNPFFVEQLALDLRERGVLCREQDDWGLSTRVEEVPARIEAVLIARLDRLAAEVKEVVQTAAVLGQEFEVQVLSRMLQEMSDIAGIVQAAEAERIWTALREMRYLFRHALMRDAAYEMQLRARLRSLHRLAAEAIEQLYAQDLVPYSADLAYHYGRAGDVEHEGRYARLAGEQAAARFANAEAIAHLSRALDLTPERDWHSCVRLLLDREGIYHLQGNCQAELEDLEAAESLLARGEREGEPVLALRVDITLRRARYAEVTGDYPTAIATARRAIELARVASDARGEVRGNLTLGQVYRYQGDLSRARQCAESATALARQAQLRLEEGEGIILLGTIAASRGESDTGLSCMEQSLHVAREVGHVRLEASALVNLGNVFVDQGELERAWPYYEEALETFHRIGFRRGEGTVLNNMGNMAARAHDYARARTLLEQALPIRREIGDRLGETIVMRNLGVVLMGLGQYEAARGYFEKSLDLSRKMGDRNGQCGTGSNLSLLYHLLGEQDAARVYGEQAAALAGELGDRWVQGFALTHLGHALASLGRLDEAIESYKRALGLRREAGAANLVAETQAGLARVALAAQDLPAALGYVEEILSFLESDQADGGRALRGNEEPLRIYLTCYKVLAANGDPRADEVLAAARGELEAQAGRIPDEETRRSFLEKVAVHKEIAH